jgi:hypothetical protein
MGSLVGVDMIYDWASYWSEIDGLCGIAMGSLAACGVMISTTIFLRYGGD